MDAKTKIDQYFQGLEQQDQFSGVVLITQGQAALYSGAFGYASRSWKCKNSLETRFDTASVTKLFTAVAVMQLIDRGKLAFDTRVVDFLELEGSSISPEVNLYHLLTHTSGIGDDAEEENDERYEDLWKSKPNYAVTQTADFLPQFIFKPANFPPGQGCRYCNCSFVLLGLALEKVTGMAYRDYVRQNIFAPAGMAHSDFLRMDRVNENVAEGCDPIFEGEDKIVGWKKNIYSFPPIGSPDSGAYVTAGDLDRFLRAVRAGKLLSPQLTEAFFTPQVHYNERKRYDARYGFGLMFYVTKTDKKVVCYQKDGVNAGVSAIIRSFPDRDINVVILSNMEEGAWDPIWYVHDVVLEGMR